MLKEGKNAEIKDRTPNKVKIVIRRDWSRKQRSSFSKSEVETIIGTRDSFGLQRS